MAVESLGAYEIVGQLARGHTTDLLLARTRGMGGFERYVALKRVRDERYGDEPFLQAFLAEARLAASLHHRNIVQVQDIGEARGIPYFAMEYIHGEDLRAILACLHDKGEQLPLQHLITLGSAVAAALHHAHEQRGPDGQSLGVIHRDVSPGNILVGFDGTVKVVDFSMAKASITTVTRVGAIKGKAGYMAPEQCAGAKIDRRSDVFALGILLYEMATVRRLFKGETDLDTMRTISLGTIPKPSEVRPEIAPRLEAIIMKALARLPADRYQTAAELGAALEAFAAEAGVVASTTALAGFLKDHFGEPPEPWRAAEPNRPQARSEFDGDVPGVALPAGAEPRKQTPRLQTESEPTSVASKRFESNTAVDLEAAAEAGAAVAADAEGPAEPPPSEPVPRDNPTTPLKPGAFSPSAIASKFVQGKLDELGGKPSEAKLPEPKAEAKLPEPKAEAKLPEPKAEAKLPEPKAEAKAPEAKASEAKPEAKLPGPKVAPKLAAKPAGKSKTPAPLPPPPDAASAPAAAKAEPDDDGEPGTRADTEAETKAPVTVVVTPPPPPTTGTPPQTVAGEIKKPEQVRGDETELVEPLPLDSRPVAAPVVRKKLDRRYVIAGVGGVVVVAAVILGIGLLGHSDLDAKPVAPPEEPAAASPPEPSPAPVETPPPSPAPEPPPPPPPEPKPEPVASPPPPPPPPPPAPAPAPKPAPHPHHVAKKPPAKPPVVKKKPSSLEYDPNSLLPPKK